MTWCSASSARDGKAVWIGRRAAGKFTVSRRINTIAAGMALLIVLATALLPQVRESWALITLAMLAISVCVIVSMRTPEAGPAIPPEPADPAPLTVAEAALARIPEPPGYRRSRTRRSPNATAPQHETADSPSEQIEPEVGTALARPTGWTHPPGVPLVLALRHSAARRRQPLGRSVEFPGIVSRFGSKEREPRIIDRRAEPIQGYRAVHAVVYVDELPIEIQIRTSLRTTGLSYSRRRVTTLVGGT